MKNTLPFKNLCLAFTFLMSITFVNAQNNSTSFSSNPLLFADTCFVGGNIETSFGSYPDIAGLDADLMEWTGTGWNGSWPNANLSIPPLNNSTCRAIFMGASSGWTGGGEGFGIRLNTPLVAGQEYELYFTYVSHGTASTGSFSPNLFTNTVGNSIWTAYEVGQIPAVGTAWETNSFTFTATAQQDGHDWILLHTLTNTGSGIVGAYCCGEINSECITFSGSVTTNDADCVQGGTATASVSGNCSVPTYTWSTGEVGATISNLNAGNYSVTIVDDCCEDVQTFSIDQIGNAPLADLGEDLSICDGNVITLNAENNGSTYLWNTGGTTQTIQVTTPGTYAVTITNSFGCTSQDEIEITPTEITLAFEPSNPSCNVNSGMVDLEVANGQAPYTYNWSNGAQTQDVQNLTPGWYFVTTTDANNCFTIDSIFIDAPVLPTAVLAENNNLCPDASNGSIDLQILTGTAPFDFNWSNGANTEDISNLPPDDYVVTITDANNCSGTFTATVTGPPSFQYAFSTEDACGDYGEAYIQVNSGGNGPYTYSWSNGASTQLISNLSGGSYTVTVTDSGNCTFTANTFVTTFDEVILDVEKTDISCFGLTDGSINVDVVQGASPYSYEWDNGALTPDLQDLDNGTYTIFVTDDNGCISAISLDINEPTPISLNVFPTPPTNVNDGALTISPTGGTPPYMATWSNDDIGFTADSLSLGMYTVSITDGNGCMYSQTINLTLTSTIEDETLTQFEVYPNPNDGQFYIDLAFAKKEHATVRIFDVLGRELFVEYVVGTNAQVEIDVRRFAAGVYFAVLDLDGKRFTQRVVVE